MTRNDRKVMWLSLAVFIGMLWSAISYLAMGMFGTVRSYVEWVAETGAWLTELPILIGLALGPIIMLAFAGFFVSNRLRRR